MHKLVSIHTCVELLVLAHIKNEPQRTEPTSPHPNPAGWFHERGRSWSEAGKTATGQLDHIGTTRWGHRRRGGGYRRTAAEPYQPHRQRHQQQHRSGRNGIRKKPGTFFTARPTVVQDVQLLYNCGPSPLRNLSAPPPVFASPPRPPRRRSNQTPSLVSADVLAHFSVPENRPSLLHSSPSLPTFLSLSVTNPPTFLRPASAIRRSRTSARPP